MSANEWVVTTTTGGTGADEFRVVMEYEEPFPWHWPSEHRRLLLEAIEASERLLSRRPEPGNER